MSNIKKCPNCIEAASEAYRQGYADAMKLYQEEILKTSQSRPIQIVVPENDLTGRSVHWRMLRAFSKSL